MKIKSILGVIFIYAVLGHSNPVLAIPVNFDLINDGTTTTLAAGSADPALYALNVGDQLTYTVSALNNDYWQANTSFYFFGGLFVLDSGARTGNWAINFKLDGGTVASANTNALTSSLVHIGGSAFLAAGLLFDEIEMTYDFLASTATTDILQSRDFVIPLSNYSTNRAQLAYTVSNGPSIPVSAPPVIFLIGAGLLGLLGVKKRKA